jgi:hypothetical protein
VMGVPAGYELRAHRQRSGERSRGRTRRTFHFLSGNAKT